MDALDFTFWDMLLFGNMDALDFTFWAWHIEQEKSEKWSLKSLKLHSSMVVCTFLFPTVNHSILCKSDFQLGKIQKDKGTYFILNSYSSTYIHEEYRKKISCIYIYV